MDARDGGGGAGEFAGTLRTKAKRIETLAVDKRAEDINDFVGRGTCLPVEDEQLLYGTRTGRVVAIEVVPGNPEWAALQKWYSWVPEVFEPFTRLPDPRDFDPLVMAMDKTLDVLGADSPKGEPKISTVAWGNMQSTADWITDWYGDAATQFVEFSDPFKYIGNNHAAIADVLRRGAAATGKVFGNARKDVQQIADATVTALQGKSPMGGDDLAFALGVVSAVAGFIASVPSMGASLAIFFGAVSGTTSIAKDTVDTGKDEESKVEAVVGGHTVDAILSSMAQELSRLNRHTDEKEREIKGILERNLTVVTDPATRKQVEAPRPHLADLTSGAIRPHLSPPQ